MEWAVYVLYTYTYYDLLNVLYTFIVLQSMDQ